MNTCFYAVIAKLSVGLTAIKLRQDLDMKDKTVHVILSASLGAKDLLRVARSENVPFERDPSRKKTRSG
jgi:hypothetical protein